MGNLDFNSLYKELVSESTQLVISAFKNYKKEAKADIENFTSSIKPKLEQWTIQLAEGKITKDDLEFLILQKKELLEMKALKQVGIAQIELDKLKNNVLSSIIGTIVRNI